MSAPSCQKWGPSNVFGIQYVLVYFGNVFGKCTGILWECVPLYFGNISGICTSTLWECFWYMYRYTLGMFLVYIPVYFMNVSDGTA